MNLIISVAGLVLCMLGLVQAWAGRQMEENARRYFGVSIEKAMEALKIPVAQWENYARLVGKKTL